MRRAGGIELLGEEGNFFGFLLKGNYCAEHEHGTRGLSSLFLIGFDPDAVGLPRRTATRVPAEQAVLFGQFAAKSPVGSSTGGKRKREKGLALIVETRYNWRGADKDGEYLKQCALNHGLRYGESDEVVGSWDSESFALFAYSDRAKAELERLHGAIMAGDLAIWAGGGIPNNPFSPSGLVVAVASLVPEEGARMMLEADLETRRLKEAAKATGIEARLRTARKGFYALSPRFRAADDGRTSEHPVIFWLNPMEQNDNNFGWFTVEDLDDWIEGRGPVPNVPKSPGTSLG